MKSRIRLALQFARCILIHEVIEHRGGLRCKVCRPIRERKTDKPAQMPLSEAVQAGERA